MATKMARLIRGTTNKETPLTVADIPADALDAWLQRVKGFPGGTGSRMQNGWPSSTKFDDRALEDFAAGAQAEQDAQDAARAAKK